MTPSNASLNPAEVEKPFPKPVREGHGGATEPEEGAKIRWNAVSRARIVEVGPRDGLQNESVVLATEDKVRFVELLTTSGLRDIEVSSFVSPGRVPQLADAEAVFALLPKQPGVRYSALVPNRRGLDRAMTAGVDGIALFTAASDAFALRNIGRTIEQSLTDFRALVPAAKSAGLWVRAYVSTAFACPFSGPTAPGAVLPIVRELLEMGVEEIAIGDTIGSAQPDGVARLTESLLLILPPDRFAYHFHDTRGAALENVKTALDFGLSIFDSSTGGAGGCPFAPGAPGNLATEDLLGLLNSKGIESGVDIDLIRDAAAFVKGRLAHEKS
jgi:hydroxymethylglutaryl-CoA lyase